MYVLCHRLMYCIIAEILLMLTLTINQSLYCTIFRSQQNRLRDGNKYVYWWIFFFFFFLLGVTRRMRGLNFTTSVRAAFGFHSVTKNSQSANLYTRSGTIKGRARSISDFATFSVLELCPLICRKTCLLLELEVLYVLWILSSICFLYIKNYIQQPDN